MGKLVTVAKAGDLQPGQGKVVTAEGLEIALFNVGGKYYAIDNTCSHAGGPLAEGSIEGSEVTCPWHGASFNVTTGEACSPPAPTAVACYPIKIAGDDVQVEV